MVDKLSNAEAMRLAVMPNGVTESQALDITIDEMMVLPLGTKIHVTEWYLTKMVNTYYTVTRSGRSVVEILRETGWKKPIRMTWARVEWYFLRSNNEAQRKIIKVERPKVIATPPMPGHRSPRVTGIHRRFDRKDSSITIWRKDLERVLKIMKAKGYPSQSSVFTYLVDCTEKQLKSEGINLEDISIESSKPL